MPIIPNRNLAPRSHNYRFVPLVRNRRGLGMPPLQPCRRGMGACTPDDPSGCVGPYSNPVFNLDYQMQLQSQGQPVNASPVTYTPPVQPVNKTCQPWDVACVEGNVAQQVGYQQAIGVAQADADYQQCIANGTGDATCRQRWPVGYSGEVPFNTLTPAQQVGQMATPAQAAAQFAAANTATAAAVKLALTKAGQTPAAVQAAFGGGAPVAQSASAAGTPSASMPMVTPDVIAAAGASPSTGFSLSSIPWWAWAGGAALGLYAMQGKR